MDDYPPVFDDPDEPEELPPLSKTYDNIVKPLHTTRSARIRARLWLEGRVIVEEPPRQEDFKEEYSVAMPCVHFSSETSTIAVECEDQNKDLTLVLFIIVGIVLSVVIFLPLCETHLCRRTDQNNPMG